MPKAIRRKSFSRIVVEDGKLSAKLPYKFGYKDGKLDATLAGAGLTLNDLSLKRGADAPFVFESDVLLREQDRHC